MTTMTKPKTIKVRVPGVVAPDGRSEHVEKINPSVMRALRAVGEVFRLIQNSASKMQGPRWVSDRSSSGDANGPS